MNLKVTHIQSEPTPFTLKEQEKRGTSEAGQLLQVRQRKY